MSDQPRCGPQALEGIVEGLLYFRSTVGNGSISPFHDLTPTGGYTA